MVLNSAATETSEVRGARYGVHKVALLAIYSFGFM